MDGFESRINIDLEEEFPPWLLRGTPYRVQQIADKRAGFNKGFLLWLEMGLGKTAVALQNWQRWRHRADGPRATRLIVVTTNSMRLTWYDEVKRWIDDDIDVEVSPERPHRNPQVFIVNYEAFAGQGKGWGSGFERARKLAMEQPTMLVVDECHRIKKHSSRWSKSVRELGKDCIASRGLTGTPWGQNVEDLYPQFRLAKQLEGVNPVAFRTRYAKRGGYMGKQVTGVNEVTMPELHRIMNVCSMRALKSEWTDLPPKMPPTTVRVELPAKLVPHYRSMLEEFLVEIESRDPDDPITAKMVVTQMGKLQQISSGFIYDEMKHIHRLMPISDLPKYKALVDKIEGLGEDSKMLIFCHFKPTVQALVDALVKDFAAGCAVMASGMSPEEIERQKAMFNQDGGVSIMVAQISVGSAGHTLLGGPNRPCYTTSFFENSYVLIDREQAQDRNHRFGQKSPVSYYDFCSTEVERAVLVALQNKRSLAHAVIDYQSNKRP